MRVLKRVLIFFTVICLLAGASIALNDSSRTRPGKDLSELQGTLGKAGEGDIAAAELKLTEETGRPEPAASVLLPPPGSKVLCRRTSIARISSSVDVAAKPF